MGEGAAGEGVAVMTGDLFVMVLMVLNLGASITYGWQGQWVKSLYWISALLLNFCVLRMK